MHWESEDVFVKDLHRDRAGSRTVCLIQKMVGSISGCPSLAIFTSSSSFLFSESAVMGNSRMTARTGCDAMASNCHTSVIVRYERMSIHMPQYQVHRYLRTAPLKQQGRLPSPTVWESVCWKPSRTKTHRIEDLDRLTIGEKNIDKWSVFVYLWITF